MVTAARALAEFRKIIDLWPLSELNQVKRYLKTLMDEQPLRQRHLLELMALFLPSLKKWHQQEKIPAELALFTFLTNAILSGSTSPLRHYRLTLTDMVALSVEQPRLYPYWLSCKAPDLTSMRDYERAIGQNDRSEQLLLAQWLLVKIQLDTERYRSRIEQSPLPLHAVNHLGLLAQAGILTPTTSALIFAAYPDYPLAESQLVDCLLHLKAKAIYTDESASMLYTYLTKGLQQFAEEIHIASISIGIDIDPNHLVALLCLLKNLDLWSLENVKHIMSNDEVLYAMMRGVYANIHSSLRSLKEHDQLTQENFERIFSEQGIEVLEQCLPISRWLQGNEVQTAHQFIATWRSTTKIPPGLTAESRLRSQTLQNNFNNRRESCLLLLEPTDLSR